MERFFARNAFCKKLQSVWAELGRRLQYVALPAGEVVTSQGDKISDGPCMYIILDGSVKVFVQDKGGVGYQEAQLVTVLKAGSVFGEVGHFMERSATVVTESPCQFVTLTKWVLVQTGCDWSVCASLGRRVAQ